MTTIKKFLIQSRVTNEAAEKTEEGHRCDLVGKDVTKSDFL